MKKIISTILILCMLAGIGLAVNAVTLNRTSEGCIQLADFYEMPKDTVDVLFIGSSHVYYSVNTCKLYDEYGMASYLLASPGQPVWISYYFLEEALKTQSPGLVVFDVCTLYQTEDNFGSMSWESLISMKPSRTKWEAVKEVGSGSDLMDEVGAFFSFPYYHTRYSQLEKRDYKNTDRVRYNGYKPDFTVISESELKKWADVDRSDFDGILPISERAEEYLRRMIELCQKKGISFALVNSPYLNHTAKKQKSYNYVRQIADEYGVPFFEGNDFVDEMQIDDALDFLEPSHLNYDGGLKYTGYLAGWLKDHFDIPNRSGDKDSVYGHWDEVSRRFMHIELLGRELAQVTKQEEYLNLALRQEDCVVITYQAPDGELTVYEDGRPVYTGPSGQKYFQHFSIASSDLTVENTGNIQVMIDHKAYALTDEGMNVIVYDKTAERVIDAVGFDAGRDLQAVRK